MKAAVVHGLNDIRIEELPLPHLGTNEILVQVGAAGVCSTDVKQLAGLSPPRQIPAVLGHELAGTIAEVGSNVANWKVGQRVAVYPIAACGQCYFCQLGKHSLCEKEFGLGRGVNGAFAEYCCVPAEILDLGGVVDIGAMAFETATLIEPLSCVISASRQCRIQPGDTVAVVGCGPMGQLNIYASKRSGARVIAVDFKTDRLAGATHMGADLCLNPNDTNVRETILAQTGQRGADIVIVAVGFVDAVLASLPYVRNGGLINIFGGTPQGDMLEIDPRWLHYGEIYLTGTFGSSVDDFQQAHVWMQQDADKIRNILSHTCRLPDIVDAVTRVKEGRGTKTVVLM